MLATFTNGRVTLLQDLVFGLCVLAEQGPFPFNQLTLEEIDLVLSLIDFNPTCPAEYTESLRFHRKALTDKAEASQPTIVCKWCGVQTATPCDYSPTHNSCEHA